MLSCKPAENSVLLVVSFEWELILNFSVFVLSQHLLRCCCLWSLLYHQPSPFSPSLFCLWYSSLYLKTLNIEQTESAYWKEIFHVLSFMAKWPFLADCTPIAVYVMFPTWGIYHTHVEHNCLHTGALAILRVPLLLWDNTKSLIEKDRLSYPCWRKQSIMIFPLGWII